VQLFDLALEGFLLEYHRDEKLNNNVEVHIESALANKFEYQQFGLGNKPRASPLARISKSSKRDHCYFLVKLSNVGSIDVQGVIEKCQLSLHSGILPLISDWLLVDDSVFPEQTQFYKPIRCSIRLPEIVAVLESQTEYVSNLKTVGELVIEVIRSKAESEHFLREGFGSGRVSAAYIEKQREFMSVKVNLGVEFFHSLSSGDRKLLEKGFIEVRQLNFLRVRDDKLARTMNLRVLLSDLRGSISIDDVILLRNIGDRLEQGKRYQQQYREFLQSQLADSPLRVNSSSYAEEARDENRLEEMLCKVQTLSFYLISKENDEYIPLFRLKAGPLETSLFVNSGSQVVSADLNCQVSYFNDRIFRWEPLLEPTEAKVSIMNGKEQNMELDVANDIFINLSSENAVSLKKYLRAVEGKLQEQANGKYKPDLAQEFLSRYVIENQTGYPLEIFDHKNVSAYVVMHG
jgi:hypothetical protein